MKALVQAILATKTPNTLMAQRYFAEVEALAADPILIALESEIPPDCDTEGYGFTLALNQEYTKRGGKHLQSIGGALWAVKALRAARCLETSDCGTLTSNIT